MISDIYSIRVTMADVSYFGQRQPVSRIESLLATVEQTCRVYDKRITKCVWLLVVLIVWCIVANSIVRVDDITYSGAMASGDVMMMPSGSRLEARVLYRVFGVMTTQCNTANLDVVIGPQIHVNGKPYLRRVMRICGTGMDLVNPYVAVSGRSVGTCVDEYNGVTKRIPRNFPVTVHSDNRSPSSFMDIEQVCTLMQALDMLDGKW